jgi:hypothetical protein
MSPLRINHEVSKFTGSVHNVQATDHLHAQEYGIAMARMEKCFDPSFRQGPVPIEMSRMKTRYEVAAQLLRET